MTVEQYARAHSIVAEELGGFLDEMEDVEPDEAGAYPLAELKAAAAALGHEALVALGEALADLDDARAAVASAEAVVRESVRDALQDGVPATQLAERLGVSRAARSRPTPRLSRRCAQPATSSVGSRLTCTVVASQCFAFFRSRGATCDRREGLARR